MTPVTCLITDRHRTAGALVDRIAAAAAAGVHLVQIRERDLDGAALLSLVRDAIDAVRGTRTRVLVNDRLDVALAAGAHGVHLRGESLPASRARLITPPGFLIGRSVHDVGEAGAVAAADGADYLIFGPVYETTSKPGQPAAGLDALRDVAAAMPLPVLAVGGVTQERFAAIASAGAAGVAAIGLFAGPGRLELLMRQAALAFDTPGAAT